MEAKQISPEKPAKCFVRRTHARDPGSTPPLPPASGCQVPDYARARAAEGAWVQTPERLLARGSWQPAYSTGGCAVSPGAMLSLQSCLTLCDLMDHSPTDSSVHGLLQAEYWSGLPFPTPGYLPNPGIQTESLTCPGLAGGFFTTSTTWEEGSKLYYLGHSFIK